MIPLSDVEVLMEEGKVCCDWKAVAAFFAVCVLNATKKLRG